MNWDAVGALGEWVGGLATVGTLFYLAYQVRQNTRSARSAAYQAAASAISAWTTEVSMDAALCRNISTGLLNPDELDEDYRIQIGMHLNALFRNYENIYYQWREKAIGDDVWKGWSEQMSSVFWSPGAQRWWPSWRNQCHTDFRAFLENSAAPSEWLGVEIPGGKS